MPELPEVETVARNLRGENPFQQAGAEQMSIVGRRVLGARVAWDRTIAAPEVGFVERISGQLVRGVKRRGKYLVIRLERDFLVVHLRMSGDLALRPAGQALEKHDRVVLQLSGEQDLVFNDTRKFGRIWLLADTGELFSKLGPEPFGGQFTPAWFYQALQKRRRQIKPLLLDQSFLAGVGNIYADESLHRAGIHPLRTADSLSEAEAARLQNEIQVVLKDGIESNGASIDWVYRGGGFQNEFRVYGRQGEPCYRCSATIAKIVVGQRGTHFCPTCQPVQDDVKQI
jgi:formamidopyrimidine-DNA glycosylase